MGRPSSYCDELADEICARMNEGRSLKSICEDEDMPSQSMVFRWLSSNEGFREKYRACAEIRADALHEVMLNVATSPMIGEITTTKQTKDGTLSEVRISDNVDRSRLIINTLQWQLARLYPKKYGEKVNLEATGKDGTPLNPPVVHVYLPSNGRD